MKYIVGIFLLIIVFILAKYWERKADAEEQEMFHDANAAANKAANEDDGTS